MTAERKQDRWLERLLRRRSTSAPAVAVPSVCLDAETLAAWADGSLNARDLAAAEIHVSNCTRCTALLAAIERTAPAVSVESRSRGAVFRWLVPLAAAATAIAIWVAIPGQQVTPVAREEAASPSVTAPPPASAPPPMAAPQPAAPPVASPQPKSDLQRQRSARFDELSAGAREAAQEPRKEASAAVGAISADERAVAAPAAPAPPASADTFSQKSAAAVERRALNETVVVVIEGVSPNEPQIRWRSPTGADVERSIDGGQTWTKTASSPPGPIAAIRVVDARNAAVTTADGRTFSTTDAGATWTPVQEKPAAPF